MRPRNLRKAEKCPGCGAPVSVGVKQLSPEPTAVRYNWDNDMFTGAMIRMVKLAMRAVQELGWTLNQANETVGMVNFQTGMSWGSWSGITCTLNIEELSPNTFRVIGTGKQNLSGGQLIAFDIGSEAEGKALKAIERMKQLAGGQSHPRKETLASDVDYLRLKTQERQSQRAQELQRREEEAVVRRAKAAAGRAKRDKAYLAEGIEPGRWAW
jgi:hypothetical protein